MIDINKKYTIRDGREVVIYAVYPDNGWGVHGVIDNGEGFKILTWHLDGKHFNDSDSRYDLIEVQEPPKEFVGWLTFYQSGEPSFWMHLEEAERYADHPIARKRITIQYRDGEFDE